jgi:hypothetical protein
MDNFMEFNGIPLNFSWNSTEFYETEVDGIPWNSIEFHGKWNSTEFRQLTEFYGIRFRQG